VLTGGAGNDEIQGGTGTDTAVFSGKRTDYKVEKQGDGSIKVVDIRAGSPDGTDFRHRRRELPVLGRDAGRGQGAGEPDNADACALRREILSERQGGQ
jgi:hypothetical protein